MAVRGHWTNQWRIPHDTLKQLTAFKDEPIEFRLNSDCFRPFAGTVTNTMNRRRKYASSVTLLVGVCSLLPPSAAPAVLSLTHTSGSCWILRHQGEVESLG